MNKLRTLYPKNNKNFKNSKPRVEFYWFFYKKSIPLPKFQTKVQCLFILHFRNSKTKCYKELHLSRCSGGLSTAVANIFMRGGRKSDIMDSLFYHKLE